MSTSELRRGPGWWMDLDGSWQPPESWPESSPPLPGWLRAPDGSWYSPEQADDGAALDNAVEEPVVSPQRPIPETDSESATPKLEAVTPSPAPREPVAATLQFSGMEAVLHPTMDDRTGINRAIRAGIIAAVLATMIGIGLALLLANL